MRKFYQNRFLSFCSNQLFTTVFYYQFATYKSERNIINFNFHHTNKQLTVVSVISKIKCTVQLQDTQSLCHCVFLQCAFEVPLDFLRPTPIQKHPSKIKKSGRKMVWSEQNFRDIALYFVTKILYCYRFWFSNLYIFLFKKNSQAEIFFVLHYVFSLHFIYIFFLHNSSYIIISLTDETAYAMTTRWG